MKEAEKDECECTAWYPGGIKGKVWPSESCKICHGVCDEMGKRINESKKHKKYNSNK